MSVFCVCNITVHAPEVFAEYRLLAERSIRDHGGRYLVRGGDLEVIEGHWQPRRLVIGQFDSMAAMKRWYDSPLYQDARALRQSSALTDMVFVQGLTP